MFDIGFFEVLLVGVVALVVLGPDKLAVIAKTAGNFVGKAKKNFANIKSEISNQGSEIQEVRNEIKNKKTQVEKEIDEIFQKPFTEYIAEGQDIPEAFKSESFGKHFKSSNQEEYSEVDNFSSNLGSKNTTQDDDELPNKEKSEDLAGKISAENKQEKDNINNSK
jgi:Tat protein translocase TatB subunit